MLSSAAAVVGGLFIATQSDGKGPDTSPKTGVWCGGLVLELLSAVPFLCAVPALFHQLASSTLLHTKAPDAVNVALGYSELLPAVAILPFMLYQLAGFGTLHYVLPRAANWAVNVLILGLIVAASAANRLGDFLLERRLGSLLILFMAATVVYGVLKLRQMQAEFDGRSPARDKEKDKAKDKDSN
jgi:hypothetical protein